MNPKIAAVFPGQGSQHAGMGRFLYDEFRVAKDVFTEASDALHLDLKKLCFEASEDDLALTENTQPALLTVSIATYRTLETLAPLSPVAAAGHSVGEYAAMVAAEVFPLADAVRAVRLRGQAMQSACPVGEGIMAALMGVDEAQAQAVCAWVNSTSQVGPLEVANLNSPAQIVISGRAAALSWLQTHFNPSAFTGAPSRIKVIPLKVSAPFHSSLMRPAEDKMRMVLSEIPFAPARFPIAQNLDGNLERQPEKLKEKLIRQVTGSVRWSDCVATLVAAGAKHAIEFGSGKVLSGLIKKTVGDDLPVLGLTSLPELRAVETLLNKGVNP